MNKPINYVNKNKGFTLVEMIIALMILGIVLTLATTMIVQAFNIFGDGSRRMSAKQLAEINLTELSKYVRNGEDIMFDEENNTIIKSDNSEIIIFDIKDFKMESINGSYEITIIKKVDDQEAIVSRKVSPRN